MVYKGGLGSRSELWSAAIALWHQHPVLGVGPNNFELLVGSFFPGVRTHVNGQLLQALAEGGVVGLLALLAMIAATLYALRRGAGVLGIAVFAMVLGFWTHELFDSLLLYPKVGLAYWTLIAIALAALSRENPGWSAGRALD